MSDIYNGTKTGFMDGGSGASVYASGEMPIDLGADTLVTLLASDSTAYSFTATDADYTNGIFDGGTTATEFSGTGYNPGTDGTLGSLNITEDNTNTLRVRNTANSVTWPLPVDSSDSVELSNAANGTEVRVVWYGEKNETSTVLETGEVPT